MSRRARARRLQQGDDFHASGPSAHPDEHAHVPSNRRPSLDWANRLRGYIKGIKDNAWYSLVVSILAVITQICLRIVNDSGQAVVIAGHQQMLAGMVLRQARNV